MFGCVSTHEMISSEKESYLRLTSAREMECDFIQGIELYQEDNGEINIEKGDEDPVGHSEMDFSIKIQSKLNMAAITTLGKDFGPNHTYPSRIEKWGRNGISFIIDVNSLEDGLGIAMLSVFDLDDKKDADYGATLSIHLNIFNEQGIVDYFGFCNVLQ